MLYNSRPSSYPVESQFPFAKGGKVAKKKAVAEPEVDPELVSPEKLIDLADRLRAAAAKFEGKAERMKRDNISPLKVDGLKGIYNEDRGTLDTLRRFASKIEKEIPDF